MAAQSSGMSPQKWGLIAGLFALPLLFLFAYFGDPDRGMIAADCAVVTMFVARARWDLKRNVWFWVTLAIVATLHIPLVLFVPLPYKREPGIALLPVAVLDYGIVYGCIKLVEKVMDKADLGRK